MRPGILDRSQVLLDEIGKTVDAAWRAGTPIRYVADCNADKALCSALRQDGHNKSVVCRHVKWLMETGSVTRQEVGVDRRTVFGREVEFRVLELRPAVA